MISLEKLELLSEKHFRIDFYWKNDQFNERLKRNPLKSYDPNQLFEISSTSSNTISFSQFEVSGHDLNFENMRLK
jgi:hypothetical protein